jgi:superfamily II DNA/RNA helicase
MEFHKPTPIQEQIIPHALKGLDVLGSAQTGTGKTGAYGIPLVSLLMNDNFSSAIVLTPTRELAQQVLAMLKQLLGTKSNVKPILLIGGDSMFKQLTQLKGKPRLIVGTPGRVNDHLLRGSLKLNTAKFLVLDEIDRMLDMGFSIQIQKIVKFLPIKHQTLMFSATMTPTIEKMAENYLKDSIRVSVGSTNKPIERIKQEVIRTTESEKFKILTEQLDKQSGSFVVFVKTKSNTEKLAKKLCLNGHSADAIHGDLRQRIREKVIASFRSQKNRILVATDVAARGLDIPHIECVFNYDMPQCPEDYIHRIGRTGRAGAEGIAVSLVTAEDGAKWKAIHKLMNPGEKIASDNSSPDTPDRKRRGNKRFGFRNRDRDSKGGFGKSFRSRDRDSQGEGNSFRNRDRDSQGQGNSFRNRDKDSQSQGNSFRNRDKDSQSQGNSFRNRDKDSQSQGNSFRNRDRDSQGQGNSFRGSDKKSQGRGKLFLNRDKKYGGNRSGN